MKEEILQTLSQREVSLEEFKEMFEDEGVSSILKELENTGLIFGGANERYSITFLGNIRTLGKKSTYKRIVKNKDLFEFFRTRISSAIPKELLIQFEPPEDYHIIGKPDFVERQKEITAKSLSLQPHVEKVLYVSAPIMFRPSMLHMLGVLKERSVIRVIVPKNVYEKHSTLYAISKRVTNFEARAIEESNQYMGLLHLDSVACLFGFNTIDSTPGWDAVIYTENNDCIAWVKKNFEYMWDNLAEEP
jgi:predicted transcriptional regulator